MAFNIIEKVNFACFPFLCVCVYMVAALFRLSADRFSLVHEHTTTNHHIRRVISGRAYDLS